MSWDYDEPFEECPKCGRCGNWHWTGICGHKKGVIGRTYSHQVASEGQAPPEGSSYAPQKAVGATQGASKGIDSGEN